MHHVSLGLNYAVIKSQFCVQLSDCPGVLGDDFALGTSMNPRLNSTYQPGNFGISISSMQAHSYSLGSSWYCGRHDSSDHEACVLAIFR